MIIDSVKPDLSNNLVGVLCTLRRYPCAIICDMEKMFHEFIVRENNQDYLRFLFSIFSE